MTSPLGRYSDAVAAIVSVVVIAAWVAVHSYLIVTGVHADTTAIDSMGLLAVGVVLGQRQATNGAGKLAAAAHARLDAINAPPAGAPVDGTVSGPAPNYGIIP